MTRASRSCGHPLGFWPLTIGDNSRRSKTWVCGRDAAARSSRGLLSVPNPRSWTVQAGSPASAGHEGGSAGSGGLPFGAPPSYLQRADPSLAIQHRPVYPPLPVGRTRWGARTVGRHAELAPHSLRVRNEPFRFSCFRPDDALVSCALPRHAVVRTRWGERHRPPGSSPHNKPN